MTETINLNFFYLLVSCRLFQMKMEREQNQTEIRDMQDQLSEMHDELDSAKRSQDGERELLIEVSRGGKEEWNLFISLVQWLSVI